VLIVIIAVISIIAFPVDQRQYIYIYANIYIYVYIYIQTESRMQQPSGRRLNKNIASTVKAIIHVGNQFVVYLIVKNVFQ